ncbi:MAG: TSUP family transporter [Planctomycetes bacterium]|nr:TSUP family transporter [Planctomycetota bacterium]
MDVVWIGAAAFLASGLTLYSGFGLGTLLLPVFAMFAPVEVAVASTAVVHGANSAFKALWVGRHADRDLVVRFGVPAVLGAFAGAAALGLLVGARPLAMYEIAGRPAQVTAVKLAVAILISLFAAFDLVPSLRALRFDRRSLAFGGALSGFFGGVSGHQGALRSAFLGKVGVSAEAFVGTNAVLAFAVDSARLSVYAASFLSGRGALTLGTGQAPAIVSGIAGALLGVAVSSRFLRKATMEGVRTLTGGLLLAVAAALGAGVI